MGGSYKPPTLGSVRRDALLLRRLPGLQLSGGRLPGRLAPAADPRGEVVVSTKTGLEELETPIRLHLPATIYKTYIYIIVIYSIENITWLWVQIWEP